VRTALNLTEAACQLYCEADHARLEHESRVRHQHKVCVLWARLLLPAGGSLPTEQSSFRPRALALARAGGEGRLLALTPLHRAGGLAVETVLGYNRSPVSSTPSDAWDVRIPRLTGVGVGQAKRRCEEEARAEAAAAAAEEEAERKAARAKAKRAGGNKMPPKGLLRSVSSVVRGTVQATAAVKLPRSVHERAAAPPEHKVTKGKGKSTNARKGHGRLDEASSVSSAGDVGEHNTIVEEATRVEEEDALAAEVAAAAAAHRLHYVRPFEDARLEPRSSSSLRHVWMGAGEVAVDDDATWRALVRHRTCLR
jgi:hypothetical protein